MDPKRELTIVCAEASATSVDSLPGVRRDQFARKLVGSELAGICEEIGFMCDEDLVFGMNYITYDLLKAGNEFSVVSIISS
jgi:hypothetical protein